MKSCALAAFGCLLQLHGGHAVSLIWNETSKGRKTKQPLYLKNSEVPHASHEGSAAGSHRHGSKDGHVASAAEEESVNASLDSKGENSTVHGFQKATTQEEAHVVAVGLMASVILIPTVVSLALSEGRLQELTLKMLDTFTSIFLAVVWFNTFQQILETSHVADAFPLATDLIALVQVIALYMVAMYIAWLWRGHTMGVSTFCNCGAHFIAFAGIAAAGRSQQKASQSLDGSIDIVAVFLFCAVSAGILGAIFATNWFFWRRKCKDEAVLNHAVEELEVDVIGLVLSFLLTQAVRRAITGDYPVLHFLQLESMRFESHPRVHAAWQRHFMLVWSVGIAIVAAVAMPKLNHLVERSDDWRIKQLLNMTKMMLIMLVAWGLLLVGEWEFYEVIFKGQELFGQMLFACLATFSCITVLFLMSRVMPAEISGESAITFSNITTGISLVSAWSWEHCFNTAFDLLGQKYEVGYGGLVPKIILSIVVPCAILPTYLNHIRPRVLEIEKAHHHAGSVASDGHRDAKPLTENP